MNPTASKRSVMIVAAISSFLTPFMGSSVNIALPRIAHEFGVDVVSLGWVSTIYTVAAAILLLPFGRVADIVGRKRIFMTGVSIYGISTILSAMATSAPMLIACRALEGAGGALIFGTGVAMLTSVYPPHERGRALGLNVAATYLGLSLGPSLGGLLTQQLGWRSIFLSTMPLAALIVLLTLWKVQGEWAEARGEGFDGAGSLLYGLALAATMYGLTVLPRPLGFGLILAGLLGLGAFVAWEGRAKSPLLDISVFRQNTVFALSNLAAWLNYGATAAVGFVLSLYLQHIQGLSPQDAGWVLFAQPVMQAAFSPLAGRLSDRMEPRVVASAGMAATVVGLVLLTTLGPNTPLTFVVACLLLLGLGFAFFSSPNMHAIMGSVDRRHYGVASGMLGTMRLTGQMFSMGMAMLVFALIIGRVQIAPEHYGRFIQSAHIVFMISAVLCSGGILASLSRGRVHREPAIGT